MITRPMACVDLAHQGGSFNLVRFGLSLDYVSAVVTGELERLRTTPTKASAAIAGRQPLSRDGLGGCIHERQHRHISRH
jgi:hypothetical protein